MSQSCWHGGDGQTVVLRSDRVPFGVLLHRRHGNGSRVLVRRVIAVLEANDIQLSNVGLVWEAVKEVIAERADIPDLIIFVETDVSPMAGWVLKDGPHEGQLRVTFTHPIS